MVDPRQIKKAIAAQQAGQFEKAARLYRRVLKADPEHVDALHFYGLLQFQLGRTRDAVRFIERALASDPHYYDAHNNLGNLHKECGRLAEAADCYRRAVTLRPGAADAWNNLGVVLRARGLLEEAERAYLGATGANPSHAAAWQNYGNLLARMDRLNDAVDAYLKVLELKPHDTLAYDALGKALCVSGRTDEAVRVYRDWLRAEPDNGVARHLLAACSGSDAPDRAADGYVEALFDSFSSSFDQVLDSLGYRAPALVSTVLEATLAAPGGDLDVLDAGCGTGLCADFLRPRARRLVGVDLSSGMLARARARGQYDHLVRAELSAWLAERSAEFDLAVSADTFCYFGRLDSILRAAAGALRSGGWLVFTVEEAVRPARSFELTFSGRYSHDEQYTRNCLSDAGFVDVQVTSDTLRTERHKDVRGLIAAARRA